MGRLTAEVNHQFTHQYLVPGGRGKLRKLPADGVALPVGRALGAALINFVAA